jgi:serine/threonine protein kinase/predicted negative regulator of RcsB-dependent stress response
VNTNQWERVKQIFDLALEQPLSERHRIALEACKGDEELVSVVEGLLAADDQAGSFLETCALAAAATHTEQPLDRVIAPGEIISGRFQIVRLLGKGGMGQVYEAADAELGVRVALKTIRPEISADVSALLRFKREVELTRRVTHPNVCRIFDLGWHIPQVQAGMQSRPGFAFLTMELLNGQTLSDLLLEKGRLTPEQALPMVEQVADGLAAAHNLGIVHRDIKPSNMILVPNGGGTRVVVTDFGLARFVATPDSPTVSDFRSLLTEKGRPMGTVAYMAPEQLEGGEVTPATDIYGFGLVIYEMISGRRAFNPDLPFGGAAQRLKGPPPPPSKYVPEIDARWEAAIMRCLQVDPKSRFQGAREVVQEIKGDQRPLSRSDPAPARRTSRRTSLLNRALMRRPRPLFFSVMTVLVLGVALSIFFFRHYSAGKPSSIPIGATVLLTDIKNNVGDDRYDGIAELLRGQILQSAYFHVMSRQEIQDTLERMTRAKDLSLSPSTAREVALRAGAPRVIFGAVSRIGDDYALDIEIQQPDSDPHRARAHWENHWSWRDTASTDFNQKTLPPGLLDAVRDSGDWIRHKVGESANDIARLNLPPQDVTTDNWVALSQFALAENFGLQHERDKSLIALQNAVAADPHFALAYTKIGDLSVSLRRYEEGYKAYKLALSQENQRRLTRREQDRLRGIFALDTGDFPTAQAAFRDYTVYYPNDYLGYFYQAYPLMMMLRVEESLTVLKEAEKIDPLAYSVPSHIAMFNLILGNFSEAQKAIDRLRQIGYSDDADDIEGGTEFLQDHYEKTQDVYSRLRQSKEAVYRTRSYSLLSCLAAELGKYREALKDLNEGISSDIAEGDTVDRADKLLDRAYLHLKQRDYAGTLADSKAALELDRSFQRSATAASLLGRAAADAKGQLRKDLITALTSVEAGLGKGDFRPISTIARARVRGEILLAQGKPKAALRELETASRQDAPATDRDYLARALLAAAAQEDDTKVALEERQRALQAYERMAFRPGQIWQLPEEYPPGYLSDEVLSYTKLAAETGTFDQRARNELGRYCVRRKSADQGLPDVGEARLLLQREHGGN